MRAYELNDIEIRAYRPPIYTNADVNNAVNYTYCLRDSTRGDIAAQDRLFALLDELHEMGAPADMDIKYFTKDHWFKSLWMWINIQRDIDRFHHAIDDLRCSWNYYREAPQYFPRPRRPQPPRIKNFAAIPVCTFQRKHIKICTTVLYEILCKIAKIPKKCGMTTKKGTVNEINITRTEFNSNQTGSWDLFFDMNKINSLASNHQTFSHVILSDGVSCSVQFKQPKAGDLGDEDGLTDEEIQRMWLAGEFAYELGIDPGMRTWNAAVRRDWRTGEEVIIKTIKVYDHELIIFSFFSFVFR